LPKIIKPSTLKKGDNIGIVSPASGEKTELFDAAFKGITAWGYNVSEGENARNSFGYFAGTDEQRISDLNIALRSNRLDAIFASRGGYGCSRILPEVDYSGILSKPKIILGGSDLTAVLWAIHQTTRLVTFYGPMALEMGKGLDEFSLSGFEKALQGELSGEYLFPEDKQPYSIKPGCAGGRLIGGCLSLVVSLLGTDYFGDVSGKILFLEEIGEKPFRIDRMLTHLRNAGVFEKVSGLMLGDFYKCWEEEDKESLSLNEIVEQVLKDADMPVLAGLPFGHDRRKMTLPLGIEVELDADNKKLTFLEEAVEMNV